MGAFVLSFLLPVVFVSTGEEKTPKASEILDRFVEVTGGQEAYAKIHNRVERMEFKLSYKEGAISDLLIAAAPNLRIGHTEDADGTGIDYGFYEGMAWVKDKNGARIEEGKERAWDELFANFDLDPQWRKYYETVELVQQRLFEGKACFDIQVTTKNKLPMTMLFEVDTGVRRGIILDRQTPYGTIRMIRFFTDYRNVDGLLIPHKMIARKRLLGTYTEWTVSVESQSIEHNVKLKEAQFVPPKEVLALRDKAKKETSD